MIGGVGGGASLILVDIKCILTLAIAMVSFEGGGTLFNLGGAFKIAIKARLSKIKATFLRY